MNRRLDNIPEKADVVVIGGGPAGSTAANLLAHRGCDVVLLDQARHPRLMVGESILPHIWKYLDQLGAAEDIENAGFIRKSGGTLSGEGHPPDEARGPRESRRTSRRRLSLTPRASRHFCPVSA
ncbi:MAG TPA: tryptophan 7-halogenase [Gemmatimonadaceae bacterium]|nr:tryptophan 7-halogenase [Gemmatimonadaceae bacterium]